METTESRVIVEIRKFPTRPIYFKERFLGGVMAKEVLILNPDDPDKWFCVVADMKKLPTKDWCGTYFAQYYYRTATLTLPRDDRGVVVWRGLVAKDRITLLLSLFKEKERKGQVKRKIQNYGGNNGDSPEEY